MEPSIEPASALAGPALHAVRTIGRVAAAHDTAVYFVGGVPRDIVLGRPVGTDLDIVAVGDAVALARAVRAEAGGEVTLHERFGTATWRIDGVSIDLVTARREAYARPAALPTVVPGTLADDLARRDFTMNTLALSIDGEAFGPLIDRHGGRQDLRDRVVRVLHERSFADDPTRIFRAVRAEVRFGLRMEPRTEGWARAAVGGIAALSGKRVRTELQLTFEHANSQAALDRLSELGALDHLGPAPLAAGSASGAPWPVPGAADLQRAAPLIAGAETDAAFGAIVRLVAWLAANGWAGVACGRRLGFKAAWQRDLTTAVAMALDPTIAAHAAETGAVNAAIAGHRPTRLALAVAAAVAADSAAGARLAAYADVWLDRPAPLNGDDVAALGVAPGPAVGAMLDAVRRAWWDGAIRTRGEATAFVRARLAAPAEATGEGPDRSGAML